MFRSMRRTPLARSLAALLAAGFSLGLVESSALHVCPMHDGAVAHVAPAAMPAPAAEAHADHAMPSEAPGGEGAHGCSCIGDCGVVATVGTPAVRIAEVPAVVADGRPPVLRSRVTAHSATSYLFPPATAPPGARVG